ncbi:unnamed protein product, partial [Cyprideis torosa]
MPWSVYQDDINKHCIDYHGSLSGYSLQYVCEGVNNNPYMCEFQHNFLVELSHGLRFILSSGKMAALDETTETSVHETCSEKGMQGFIPREEHLLFRLIHDLWEQGIHRQATVNILIDAHVKPVENATMYWVDDPKSDEVVFLKTIAFAMFDSGTFAETDVAAVALRFVGGKAEGFIAVPSNEHFLYGCEHNYYTFECFEDPPKPAPGNDYDWLQDPARHLTK